MTAPMRNATFLGSDFLRRKLHRDLRTTGVFQHMDTQTGREWAIWKRGGDSFICAELPAAPDSLELCREIAASPNDTARLLEAANNDCRSVARAMDYPNNRVSLSFRSAAEIIDLIERAVDHNRLLSKLNCPDGHNVWDDSSECHAIDLKALECRYRDFLNEIGPIAGACDLFGPLDVSKQALIIDFLHSGEEAAWSRCCSVVVDGENTLWALWVHHDLNAPTRTNPDGTWCALPSAKQMMAWIEAAILSSKRHLVNRLDNLMAQTAGLGSSRTSIPSKDDGVIF